MKILLCLGIFIFSLTSCSRITARLFGIKALKPETTQSIMSYADKVGYNTKQQFYFIDSALVIETWKGVFPKAYIYNDSGEVVRHLACFATGVSELTSFFEQENQKKVSDTLLYLMGSDTLVQVAPRFASIAKGVHTVDSDSINAFPKTKYYVVYYWSKSFGRINKKSGAVMEQYILDHPELSATFIKINCDYKKEWGYTRKDLK